MIKIWNIIKRFFKLAGIIFCGLSLLVYTVCLFTENVSDVRFLFIGMDLLMAFFLFLLLGKRKFGSIRLDIKAVIKITGIILCGTGSAGGVQLFLGLSNNTDRIAALLMFLIFLMPAIFLIRSILTKHNYAAIEQSNDTHNVNFISEQFFMNNDLLNTLEPLQASRVPSIDVAQPSESLTSEPLSRNLRISTAESPMVNESIVEDTGSNIHCESYQRASLPLPQAISQNVTADLTEKYKHVPPETIELLWFLNGPYQNYYRSAADWNINYAGKTIRVQSQLMEEPSAIDISLPIALDAFNALPVGYYPSYRQLSPEQRAMYLNWLVDITSPVDIGYVFLFYYGLERHLFFGNAQAAISMIFKLRKFHTNRSFLTYSGDALLLYAVLHNDPDIIQRIDSEKVSPNLRLFVNCLIYHELSAQDILMDYRCFSFQNNRYIKGETELFILTLTDLMNKKYHADTFPVMQEDFHSATDSFMLALANYSLLPEQRFISLPDIATSPRVHDGVCSLLSETHETVKIKLREMRKAQKNKNA